MNIEVTREDLGTKEHIIDSPEDLKDMEAPDSATVTKIISPLNEYKYIINSNVEKTFNAPLMIEKEGDVENRLDYFKEDPQVEPEVLVNSEGSIIENKQDSLLGIQDGKLVILEKHGSNGVYSEDQFGDYTLSEADKKLLLDNGIISLGGVSLETENPGEGSEDGGGFGNINGSTWVIVIIIIIFVIIIFALIFWFYRSEIRWDIASGFN